jgi:multicomponent Na+:H+ antiporter subunit G
MELVLDAVSWVCFVAGGFFTVTGAIGVIRFPDVFTRLHAASMTDTMGAGLIVAGFAVQSGSVLTTVKLVLVLLFLWVTSPVATHAVAHAALKGHVDPSSAGRQAS